MLHIDQMAYCSKLRKENASLKVCFAIAMLFIAIAFPSIAGGIVLTGFMGIVTVRIGGVALRQYFHYLCVPASFIALSVLAIIVHISRTPVSDYAVSIGGLYLSTGREELLEGLSLCGTALSGVSCMYFMAFTTPFTDLIQVLNQFHCPSLFIELLMLTYRFLFILLEIGRQLVISGKSRLGNRTLKTAVRTSGAVFSVLFLRAFNKASILYDAMESRCYDGKIQVIYEEAPLEKKKVILAAGIVIIFGGTMVKIRG